MLSDAPIDECELVKTVRILKASQAPVPSTWSTGHQIDVVEFSAASLADAWTPPAKITIVAPSSRSVEPEEFQRLLERLETGTDSRIVMSTPGGLGNPSALFANVPAAVAIRAVRPDADDLIGWRLSPDAVPRVPSGELHDPLWQQLITAADQGVGFDVLPTDGGNGIAPGELPKLAPADPGRRSGWLSDLLTEIDQPREVGSASDWTAVVAGILQMHDFLELSHQYSQSIEGRGRNRAGDYWHGIMHRREPDASNAKYWFRRVGHHPVQDRLTEPARELLQAASIDGQWLQRICGQGWSPFDFIDFCESARRQAEPDLTRVAEQIQWIEMLLLLQQTWLDCLV